MKKKSVVAIALIAVLAIAAVLVHRAAFARETTSWRYATVTKGNIESTVSATGTLSAVTTVQVGTQVSGQVAALLVDFNDTVEKGQLLARIDPTLQQQAVTDARASLERAQAQYRQAQRDQSRSRELMGAGLVARSEFEASDSSLDVARANVKSAQVALDRARQNLEYTNIYAPIDGVVVERNVDHGQTVAASLSAPQLFLIANDLTNMQILASVGEGDIASIREGQKVRFTVQALPSQSFEGTVQQVRLQSATSENVVNYTVVVSVKNAGRKLLPGMTARVEFLTASAEDVLKVPNAALRFKPAPDAEVVATSSAPGGRPASPGRTTRGNRAGNRPGTGGTGTLYTVDATGRLQSIRVRTGLTDGSATAVRAPELKEGTKIVVGTTTPQSAAEESSNPFQSSQQPQGRRPGGF
jgi:HlyD family secretion protein